MKTNKEQLVEAAQVATSDQVANNSFLEEVQKDWLDIYNAKPPEEKDDKERDDRIEEEAARLANQQGLIPTRPFPKMR